MSSPLQRYRSLNTTSSSATKISVLESISNALPSLINASDRAELVKDLLRDLGNPSNGTITPEVTPQALVALKTLGRDPGGSSIISQQSNLEILHGLAKSQTTDVSKEALRCVANAMLLIEAGRGNWVSIGGGVTCLNILARESAPDYVFLAARILFLSTVHPSDFIVKAVDSLGAVESVSLRLDALLGCMTSGRPMSKEALIDALKYAFNILLHYPRIIQEVADKAREKRPAPVLGDLWDERFSPIVPSLLHLFNSLPQTTSSPLAPPLTHVIHALLNVPIEPYKTLWFPSSGNSTPTSTKSDPFQKARHIFSSSTSSPSSLSNTSSAIDTLRRAYNLLDATLAHFVPGDPDDPSVRALCKKEDISLDDAAPPLALLLGRMVRDDEKARGRMKQWLIPTDLDRSIPLEKKTNLLGRCLRLLTSVYFSKLKDSVGELLFCICNSDAHVMVAQLGYGNCAGYLFNKGIVAPPPAGSDDKGLPLDPDINPITGAKEDKKTDDVLAGMSDEEKEREAEKLFVLFDRMERLGMGVNPVRKAQQEGRFEDMP